MSSSAVFRSPRVLLIGTRGELCLPVLLLKMKEVICLP